MAERRCRAQMRREIFRTLRMNAKSMISQWEKESNDCAKMKRRKAHRAKDREMMKHAILQDVIEFIKGKDIFHELIHSHSNGKENISPLQIMDSQPQVMPLPLQDSNMDSLLEDMDSLLEPITLQDFDMDSLLEPITFDSLVKDKDSLLEPIAFNTSLDVDEFTEILCRLDLIVKPVVVVERCSF